jgi:hypothetical protein
MAMDGPLAVQAKRGTSGEAAAPVLGARVYEAAVDARPDVDEPIAQARRVTTDLSFRGRSRVRATGPASAATRAR